jgi:hypothetical protein
MAVFVRLWLHVTPIPGTNLVGVWYGCAGMAPDAEQDPGHFLLATVFQPCTRNFEWLAARLRDELQIASRGVSTGQSFEYGIGQRRVVMIPAVFGVTGTSGVAAPAPR